MISASLQKLLDYLGPGELDLHHLLIAIHATRYTGSFTVHSRNGVAHQIDLGSPVRLTICAGVGKGEQPPAGGLDNPPSTP